MFKKFKLFSGSDRSKDGSDGSEDRRLLISNTQYNRSVGAKENDYLNSSLPVASLFQSPTTAVIEEGKNSSQESTICVTS